MEKTMMERFVKRNILKWVDKIYLTRPDAEFVFVATKSDLIGSDSSRLVSIRDHLLSKLREHAEKHTADICYRLKKFLDNEWENCARDGRRADPQQIQAQSARWLVVNCSTLSSVAVAQRSIQNAIVQYGRSIVLPKSYARALTSVMALRDTFKGLEPKSRVASTIVQSNQLVTWIQQAISCRDTSMQACILSFLHNTGDIMRYTDFEDQRLHTVKKAILEPQLVVDFAREIFSLKLSGDKIANVDLWKPDITPLWASVKSKPEMLEMKLIMRELRIVQEECAPMKADSALLVAASWKHVPTYGNIHVGPTYLRHTRSSKSTHVHHVQWKYYLGDVLDEDFFMRLAFSSYTSLYKRHTFDGLIKYVTDKSLGPYERGPTEEQFVQLWVDQEHNDDGSYVVCVEAVAATPFVNRIWRPFRRVCKSMYEVLTKYYPKQQWELYAIEHSRNGDIEKHTVENVIRQLEEDSDGGDLEHKLVWMPPKLDSYVDIVRSPSCLAHGKEDIE